MINYYLLLVLCIDALISMLKSLSWSNCFCVNVYKVSLAIYYLVLQKMFGKKNCLYIHKAAKTTIEFPKKYIAI